MNDTYTNKALANLVRSEREKRNWTQEHLAEVAELSTRTIQRLETDGSHSPETLRSVAGAFDLDCQDLLDRAKKVGTAKRVADDPYVVVHLARCLNGKGLLDRADCHAHHSDYPPNLDKEQAEEVAGLLDYFRDFGDIRDDLPISERIKAEQEMTGMINHLGEMGLAVFTGAYRTKFRLGTGDPVSWVVAIVTITQSDDPRIVTSPHGQILPALVPRNQSLVG